MWDSWKQNFLIAMLNALSFDKWLTACFQSHAGAHTHNHTDTGAHMHTDIHALIHTHLHTHTKNWMQDHLATSWSINCQLDANVLLFCLLHSSK